VIIIFSTTRVTLQSLRHIIATKKKEKLLLEDEMLEDELERKDIENAILKGRIEKRLTYDARGTRYRLEGPAKDRRLVHVICRFKDEGTLVIITAYAVKEGK